MADTKTLRVKKLLSDQKTLVFLLLLTILMGIISPFFLTGDNMVNVLVQSSVYGIMACGMTFAIIGGDFDLSVGSTMALSTHYILTATRFGRNVYTIGGNMEVAHNSGIPTRFYKTSIFVLSALTAGIAGILNASKLNTASAVQGDNAALSVITGVVSGAPVSSGAWAASERAWWVF